MSQDTVAKDFEKKNSSLIFLRTITARVQLNISLVVNFKGRNAKTN
jgi:hypothetical protein